jgi:Flp pilus assembly protein TadG
MGGEDPMIVIRPGKMLLRRLARDRKGNAAVEMAFAAVPLCLFLFAIIATGQVMWLQNALNLSVAEAARCASVNPSLCGTSDDVQNFAAQQAGARFDDAIFSWSRTSCGNQVSASYPLALDVPFVAFSVTLNAQACFPV